MTTGSALKAEDDPDNVHTYHLSRLITTSGTFETEYPINILKELGTLLFGSRQFYLAMDTTGSQTLTVYLHVMYLSKKLSVQKWEKSW